MTIVSKFGGTSMADFEAMQRCAGIVAENPERKIIVVSATAGTTNDLVVLSASPSAQDQQAFLARIEKRHRDIIRHLHNAQEMEEQFGHTLDALKEHLSQSKKDEAWKDGLLAFGELMSSPIFTEVVRMMGVDAQWLDAREVIATDSRFGEAQPDVLKTATQAAKLDNDQVYVTQGFIASDPAGNTTTLGRGGSDYSAALFAEATKAGRLEIWTDVSGVYTTDPRIVADAFPIHEITFSEAAELSTFGGKVLHPATLKPVIRSGAEVFVGSSLHPDSRGTLILHQATEKPAIRAISLRKNQTLVTVHSLEMLGRHGFLAHLFQVLANRNISVDLVTTSEVSVSLTLDTNTYAASPVDLSQDVIQELQTFSQVEIEKGLSLIALIGNELQATAGVSGSIFNELRDFNIRLICHGASKHNLCFLVAEEDAEEVVRLIHKKFIGGHS